MNVQLVFWLIVGLVVVIYLAGVRFLIWRHLSPLARRLWIALTITQVILLVLNALVWVGVITSGPWQWFLDITQEYSLGTLLSSMQSMAAALAAFSLVLFVKPLAWWARAYWGGVGAVFVFLGLDEYLMFHERSLAVARVWLSAVGISVALLGLLVWRLSPPNHRKPFYFLLGGLGLTGAAGLFGEELVWSFVCRPIHALVPICNQVYVFEEYAEVLGPMFVLLGLVTSLEETIHGSSWNWARRIVFAGGAAWLVAMAANVWPLPAIEARHFAEPASVEYLDGEMSLVAYRVSRQVVTPGSPITLTLYWRANALLSESFALSVHVLTADEAGTVVQVEEPLIGSLASNAWPPGMVVREVVPIQLPDDLETPRGYLLMVRPWTRSVEATVSDSDRRLIGPDTVIIDSIVVLPEGGLPQPDIAADYRFEDGFVMYGYRLPAEGRAGQSMAAAFWWRTEDDVERNLVQFIHLFQHDGDYVAAFDEAPFQGTFPTYDWRRGIQVQDVTDVPLPQDMPAGVYDVYTGLYEWPSLERATVYSEGQPLQDNLIYLGQITIRQ
jgi:hypothetical protein